MFKSKRFKIVSITISCILVFILGFLCVTENYLCLSANATYVQTKEGIEDSVNTPIDVNYVAYSKEEEDDDDGPQCVELHNPSNLGPSHDNFVDAYSDAYYREWKSIAEKQQIGIPSEIDDEDFANILAMVYNSVAYDLNYNGFQCFESVAFVREIDATKSFYELLSSFAYNLLDFEDNVTNFITNGESGQTSKQIEEKNETYFGLTYTDFSNIKTDDDNFNHVEAGFVSIVPHYTETKATEKAMYGPAVGMTAIATDQTDTNYYEIINYNDVMDNAHFVYMGYYIQYFWTGTQEVSYKILENKKENYDKSLGALYSYDEDKYIFEVDFIYNGEEVYSIYEDVDFELIQQNIIQLALEQAKNSVTIDEVVVTMIDCDLLMEFLAQGQPETLYGQDVSQLKETIANIKNESESKLSLVVENGEFSFKEVPKETSSWLKGLFYAISGVLIIVSVVTSVATCGLSATLFGFVKIALTTIAVDFLVNTAITTTIALASGQSFADSIKAGLDSALDAENIIDGLVLGLATGGAGILLGKLRFCFPAGTLISTQNGLKAIETIKSGEKVYSYNQITGLPELITVNQVIENSSVSFYDIKLANGETITSTFNHKWYVKDKGWLPAEYLMPKDKLLCQDGNYYAVQKLTCRVIDSSQKTYNLSVGNEEDENFHSYYVGNSKVLVHNACTNFNTARKASVNKAWQDERLNAVNGRPTSQKWNNPDRHGKGAKIQEYFNMIKNKQSTDIGDIDNLAEQILEGLKSNHLLKSLSKTKKEELLTNIKKAILNKADDEWIMTKVFNSKYFNPGDSEFAQFLINGKGKVKGFDGAHIIDVKTCKDIAKTLKNGDPNVQQLINLVADKNNVVFLRQSDRKISTMYGGQHKLVHLKGKGSSANPWKNQTNIKWMNHFTGYTAQSKLNNLKKDYEELFSKFDLTN